MDLSQFTSEITIGEQDCPFDPENSVALVLCNYCSEYNEVEVTVAKDGSVEFAGFVCVKCGNWNGPDDFL